jgi:hypothetical protein
MKNNPILHENERQTQFTPKQCFVGNVVFLRHFRRWIDLSSACGTGDADCIDPGRRHRGGDQTVISSGRGSG